MKNYSITFKSLRAGTTYVVNIGGGTGAAVPLKGGAQPFTTEEDGDEDVFVPIRTQSGYIRIVDDGKDANGAAFDWKDLMPETDTSRPVTLTAGGTVVWQGFMQAQNFGGVLYGNPQEREFPVQCPLTVLEGTDINYQQTAIQNFAYLLKQITDCVASKGSSMVGFENIIIQGNTDAQTWLLKRIDWQNFASEDADGILTARFNLYQILEDICRFWGWTARTYRKSLYLVCVDDSSEQSFLTLTMANLATMAGGTLAGTTGGVFSNIQLSGDIFANTEQTDRVQRGPNKATTKADVNPFDETIYQSFPENIAKQMEKGGWSGNISYGDINVNYTNDLLSFNSSFFGASAVSGYGSFNLAIYSNHGDSVDRLKVIRVLRTYNESPFISLDSLYEHTFEGSIQIKGKIYQRGVLYQEDRGAGLNKDIKMSIGIGPDREHAKWFDGSSYIWGDTKTIFNVSVGYSDDIFKFYSNILMVPTIGIIIPLSGKLFIDIYGSQNMKEYDGQRLFDIVDFSISYGRYEFFTYEKRKQSVEYKSSNNNNVRQDWNVDCIYASDNYNTFGFGTLINPDNSYMNTISYNGGTPEHPEQHLANRVTAFWSTSKRLLDTELRTDAINEITPRNKVSLDGTSGYPIAISHEWRDDITKLTIIQI